MFESLIGPWKETAKLVKIKTDASQILSSSVIFYAFPVEKLVNRRPPTNDKKMSIFTVVHINSLLMVL